MTGLALQILKKEVSACRLCEAGFTHRARPVFQLSDSSTVLIAGQAPGAKVHASGVPFDDASGDRLRDWMGLDREVFYDDRKIAILPMAFCYPGTGKSGDLPPPPLCASTWRQQLLSRLPKLKLTLVIGQYAQAWHLQKTERNLTETVRAWRSYPQSLMPLPHPSPRNNIWLKKNPWFADDVIPALRERVSRAVR